MKLLITGSCGFIGFNLAKNFWKITLKLKYMV